MHKAKSHGLFFSLETRLKAGLFIRQPSQRENTAMGFLSRERELHGSREMLVPCLYLGESRSKTFEGFVVH